MSDDFNTIQEKFWAGEFGDNYVDRNVGEKLIASNTALFSKVLRNTQNVKTVLELGPNIGLNLIAINTLLPQAEISGVEINKKACNALSTLGFVHVINESLLSLSLDSVYDFVFAKGVLIHQPPDKLQDVYELMYNASNRYIFIAEYYNPVPAEVSYRGHDSVLFKRDFAGEIIDKHMDLKLVDYGFVYHRDNNFPGDDFNWFLMEKTV